MKVDILSLQKLFGNNVWYEIPVFQRQYVWDEEEQWEPLWQDVQHTAERWLEDNETGAVMPRNQSHFLGAIVLQQKPNMTGHLESREVVDGQQRLTTLQLLLDATQEVLEQQQLGDAAQRLSRMVLNDEIFRGNDPDRAFKVWPTRTDQEPFRHAMSNELPSDEYLDSNIVRAHVFFKTQVDHWLNQLPKERNTRADALERTITSLLELAVIDLDLADDPHIIFETLNARGTPLLASDLIKNMVLYEATHSGISMDSEAGKLLWRFDDPWWHDDVQQGRLVRPRIDVFLNYWLVMRTQEEVVAKDVFSTFRRHYDECRSAESIVGIADKVNVGSESYRALEQARRPGMEQFLYRRRVMQVGVLTPVLLWLLTSQVPRPQLDKCIRAFESYLVRRMICGLTTKDYNHLFIGLLARLEEAGPDQAGDTVVAYLNEQAANAREWPTDYNLEDAFKQQELFKRLTRGRLRIVLEGIEEELRTNMAESQSVPLGLTIEHIMPQGWRQHWPLSADVEDKTRAEYERDHVIQSIGNLTLVNNRLNPSLSNDPWEKKRITLDNHTTLFLNKALLNNAPDVWDEDAIRKRAVNICQAAARVWPYADKF